MKLEICLASASPRRKEILKTLGFEQDKPAAEKSFWVHPCSKEEPQIESAEKIQALALFKAKSVLAELGSLKNNQYLVAADTIVVDAAGNILGKPKDSKEAFLMLKTLSGTKHKVITAIALINSEERVLCKQEETEIKFRELSDEEINKYIEIAKPFDKAGSYGIQESASVFVEKINGCYNNVVGLPVKLLLESLEELRCQESVS